MSLRTTIFLAHAEPDQGFARELAEFLERGCDVTCYLDEGAMPPGADFIAKAEEGLAADVLALLLSEDSWPSRRPRQQWEHVLFDKARETGAQLVTILLGDCPFPELLRRRNFFDATVNRGTAMRLLKRWIWQRNRAPGLAPSAVFSRDLESAYSALADEAGTMRMSGELARRFSLEAAEDFEAVVWVPAHQRSLARVAGELGFQLGVPLEGTAEQNCRRLRELLSDRRCLLVLDAPSPEHADALIPGGRTSTVLTEEPVSEPDPPDSFERARELTASRRYAEAYELLYRLLDAEISPEACARELTWISEFWGRLEEANSLRFYYGPEPSEQLMLF